jgi:hypothetical protein
VVAGFQVSISGRFWVSTEVGFAEGHKDRPCLSRTRVLNLFFPDGLAETGTSDDYDDLPNSIVVLPPVTQTKRDSAA